MKTQCIILLLSFSFAAGLSTANAVSPVEKVIKLLEELLEEVKAEGQEEAKVYDEFSCFCKENTAKKSKAITEGQDNIEEESAGISENTAGLKTKETELGELTKEIETLTQFIANERAQREKDAAEAAAVIADLQKACDSLDGAIKAIANSQPAALMQIKSKIRDSLALADALDFEMTPKRRRTIDSLLQVNQDPDNYDSHSTEILALLKDLQQEFNGDLSSKQDEEEKAQKAHEDIIAAKEEALDTAKQTKEETETAIEKHKDNIAKGKQALLEANTKLEDDQLYLKDLTERCELKAREWDQRSQARAGELQALGKALEIISGAKDVEAARALLQKTQTEPVLLQTKGAVAQPIAVQNHNVAFVQTGQSIQSHGTFLQKSSGADSAALEQRKQQAISILVEEGKRLDSAMLSATAMRLAADPFKKVKGLIQQLIERLLQEMADEAGHKGFCDTELGKAKTQRSFEYEKTQKLNAELDELEVKKTQLEQEIEQLKEELKETKKALEEATDARGKEKEENSQTIKDSTEGLAAVKDAMKVLNDFYSGAAKNSVSLEQANASPIDEEGGVGAGGQAQGAYKGSQTKAGGIMGMLEVILSDFERSVKTTTEQDAEAHSAFVKFDRQSKGSISAKSTALEQREQDLKTTIMAIGDAMKDLQDSQELVDNALKAIEELKPQCIDTGMTYAERVKAREAEMEALKKALCQLDPEGVEPDCA